MSACKQLVCDDIDDVDDWRRIQYRASTEPDIDLPFWWGRSRGRLRVLEWLIP